MFADFLQLESSVGGKKMWGRNHFITPFLRFALGEIFGAKKRFWAKFGVTEGKKQVC